MLNFLSNGWFISIACGLLVTISWETLKMFLERKAYNRQIKQARYDFSMIIKNIIGEEKLPDAIILENLLKGIAQKHNVKFKDVSEVHVIFYSLTNDVMESNFLDYNQKIMFCEKINYLSNILSFQILTSTEGEIYYSRTSGSFNDRLLAMTTILLTSTTLINAIITFMENGGEKVKISLESLIQNPVIPLMLLILITIYIIYLIRKLIETYKIEAKLKSKEDKDK